MRGLYILRVFAVAVSSESSDNLLLVVDEDFPLLFVIFEVVAAVDTVYPVFPVCSYDGASGCCW